MGIRFADFVRTANNSRSALEHSDFMARRRVPIWQVLSLMFASIAVLSVVIGMLVPNTIIFSEIVFVIFAGVGTYVVLLLQNNRDLVLATEFQNALLSSSLTHSNKFCLIIKNDGAIAYIHPAFQELFPNFMKEARRTIGVLFEHAQISKEQRNIIFEAIKNAPEKVMFDVIDSKKQVHRLIMTVEAVVRPQGFTMLRGYEFVENREAVNPLSDKSKMPVFNKASFDLFSSFTGNMNIGVYMTDTLGNITYASPTLEKWLAYNEDEIISRNLSLKDILPQTGAGKSVIGLQNFEGEIHLQRKVGGSIKTLLNQKAIYGGDDTVSGYIAIANLLDKAVDHDHLPDDKKSAW